jgi:hypothetical protein
MGNGELREQGANKLLPRGWEVCAPLAVAGVWGGVTGRTRQVLHLSGSALTVTGMEPWGPVLPRALGWACAHGFPGHPWGGHMQRGTGCATSRPATRGNHARGLPHPRTASQMAGGDSRTAGHARVLHLPFMGDGSPGPWRSCLWGQSGR